MRWPMPPTGPAGAGITNTAPRPATTPATELDSHDQRSTTAVLGVHSASWVGIPRPPRSTTSQCVLSERWRTPADARGSCPRARYVPVPRGCVRHRTSETLGHLGVTTLDSVLVDHRGRDGAVASGLGRPLSAPE